MEELQIVLRAAVPSDAGFILDSTIKNVYATYPNQYVDKNLFYSNFKTKLTNLINKSKITVAVNPDDLEHIFGFLIFEDKEIEDEVITILHYVYVKYNFRGNRIAERMINTVCSNFKKDQTLITHLPVKINRPPKQFLRDYKLRFDPTLLDRRFKE